MSRTEAEARARVVASGGEKTAFQELLASFQRDLERGLDEFLLGSVDDWAKIGGSTREITEPLRSFVARGGKRLRPALVYFGRRAAGGSSDDLSVEMAVELLHTYLLIHDDIMDRAETRRGGPAAHRLFEEAHGSKGWSGDAARHGEAVAILLGDLAHTYAIQLFLSSAAANARAAECFSEMCREVVVGQYLEMTAPQREGLEEKDLFTILRLKSGRYSVERPLQLGVLLGGGSESLLSGLSRYGLAMGEAFQLQDDLLGVFGDRDEVGKPVGGDLAEGKFTVLVSVAIDRASAGERDAILECLRQADPGNEEVDNVQRIIQEVGARAEVESMVAERLRRAQRELGSLELPDEARIFLTGLIDYLSERTS